MTHLMTQTSLPFLASRFGNDELAAHLVAIADALEAARENPHRVRAFRAAASSVAAFPRAVADLDRPALEELPGVGPRIAGVLLDHVAGRSQGMLERLHRHVRPTDHLTLLDGVGEKLAERIRQTLGVDRLEELEAQLDRLEDVEGVGPNKAARIRASLQAMLARRRDRVRAHRRAPLRLLLEVDAIYRAAAAAESLPWVARRTADGSRWLPILRTELEGWSFRVMCSVNDESHDAATVHVVAERDGEETRATVVTERRGRFRGQRVVRGREGESRRHHLDQAVAPQHAA